MKLVEEIAKEYYKDKAFFDSDRRFAEIHFAEGYNYAMKEIENIIFESVMNRNTNINAQSMPVHKEPELTSCVVNLPKIRVPQ